MNPATNDLVDSVIAAIMPLLTEYLSARFDKIEAVLEKLSGHVQQVNQQVNVDAQTQTKQLAEAGVSSPVQEASVSSPGHTPQEINSDSQSCSHGVTDDLRPDSELSESRMITETFEILEQKQLSTPQEHMLPLFFPEPDSPSPQPALGSPPSKQSSDSSPSLKMISIKKPSLADLNPPAAFAPIPTPASRPNRRVKKRKVKESTLEAMEPSLKRARQNFEDEEEEEEWRGNGKRPRKVAAEVAARSGKGKDKEKEKRGDRSKEKSGTPALSTSTSTKGVMERLRQRAPPTRCKWPTNMTANKKFNQQLVECSLWYHYGCVGIIDFKDVRIKGGEQFRCPPCSAGRSCQYVVPVKDPMVASKDIVCARPDCRQEEKRSDEYFMTGIVGRSTKVQGGMEKRFIWLVKWDGYSIKDCTWENEDGMSDPQSFIQDFNKTALLEGVDPEADQYSMILLQEAIAGGWVDPNA
ncbi:hypothetical protein D9615_009888 [Tricholomella constricta]|uniref:Chromo domain-containing protein n=1 Tax=Tricholomella constricta TaxID=117010 RepID=A0A8H5GZA8_9AGAR|nr:hypothetical protein D9615_009888 [Tricholomella constricta]